MNINISGVNNSAGPEKNIAGNRTATGQGSIDISTATSSRDSEGLALLQNMRKGEVFTGKILDIKQDQVTLLIKGDAQVTATLSDAFSYNIGDFASFSVKDNSSGMIILKSINSENLKNLMNDRTIGRVITAAGLSVNDATVSLVNNLMKQGMPIDSNTLGHFAKLLESVPNGTPEDVVFLAKMGMPVTEENVAALHDYYDFNEGITSKAVHMAGEFSEAVSSLMGEEAADASVASSDGMLRASALIRDLVSVFTPFAEGTQTMGEMMSKDSLSELASDVRALIPGGEGEETSDVKQNEFSARVISEFSDRVGEGNMTAKEFLTDLSRIMENNFTDRISLTRLLKSDGFKSAVENMLHQEMSVRPEDVSADGLKRMYAKIINDSGRIAQKFADNPSMAGFVESAEGAASDVNFLNDAGKFMSFVQIPLKMSGQNAKGDLYVYTNKRCKGSDNGDLKAFLHLDMEHLGPLDVLVNLNGKRVTTNFKVASDEILDYIEMHIDELNKALSGMGYNVNTEVQISDKNYSFRETVLENEMPPARIKRYSFDVRA